MVNPERKNNNQVPAPDQPPVNPKAKPAPTSTADADQRVKEAEKNLADAETKLEKAKEGVQKADQKIQKAAEAIGPGPMTLNDLLVVLPSMMAAQVGKANAKTAVYNAEHGERSNNLLKNLAGRAIEGLSLGSCSPFRGNGVAQAKKAYQKAHKFHEEALRSQTQAHTADAKQENTNPPALTTS
jgi:DNA repair exonuclease SbcCD ATPase subunit